MTVCWARWLLVTCCCIRTSFIIRASWLQLFVEHFPREDDSSKYVVVLEHCLSRQDDRWVVLEHTPVRYVVVLEHRLSPEEQYAGTDGLQ